MVVATTVEANACWMEFFSERLSLSSFFLPFTIAFKVSHQSVFPILNVSLSSASILSGLQRDLCKNDWAGVCRYLKRNERRRQSKSGEICRSCALRRQLELISLAPLVPLLGEKHLEKCSDRETTSTTKGSIAQCFKLTEYYLVLNKCEGGPKGRSSEAS